jgi:hypothetical protein
VAGQDRRKNGAVPGGAKLLRFPPALSSGFTPRLIVPADLLIRILGLATAMGYEPDAVLRFMLEESIRMTELAG